MSEDLYGDPLLQLAKNTEYQGSIEHPDHEATATNPLCGDKVTIQVLMDGETIRELHYQVRGCILCKASCSHFAHMVQGLDRTKLKDLRDRFEQFLKSPDDAPPLPDHLIFSPVHPHKSRYRCVLLPYEATLKALPDTAG